MTNLNFLSQNRGSLAAFQSNDVGYDCRLTVVRLSFHTAQTRYRFSPRSDRWCWADVGNYGK